MKKNLLIVAMMVVVIMTAIGLTACNTNKMSLGFMESVDGNVEYVKVDITDYEGKSLKELLQGEKSLGAVVDDDWGVLEIKGLKVDQTKNWICTFTSDESKKSTYDGAKTICKGDVTYYESGVGIADLIVSKDAKYLFVLIEI